MATLYINMTCGMKGPEAELTLDQVEHILNLINQLDTSWTDPEPLGWGLGPEEYIVHWKVLDLKSAMISPAGLIHVWNEPEYRWDRYKDTVGLHEYLRPIANEVLEKYSDEVIKECSSLLES